MNAEALSIPDLLIAGKFHHGALTAPVENPATGHTLGAIPIASTNQLEDAIIAAAHGGEWRHDKAQRSVALTAMAAAVLANKDDLARTLSLEIGLPYKVAQDEVAAAAGFLQFRASEAHAPEVLHDDARQRVEVVRAPIGVVGAIIPWNAPVLIACEKLGTALAAGNSVVMKPSPLAAVTLLQLGALFQPLLPAGVLSILPGGADLGEALVAHPAVGMISFTGSVRAGQAIMAAAGPGLKRLSLELGGNDAAIVLPDADVASTASKLFWGAFYRTGQVCAGIKRLYVHRDIAAPLTEALKAVVEAAAVGDPFDPKTALGPLSNKMQFDVVSRIVPQSKSAGGKVITGGGPVKGPGYFFEPTLVSVDDDSNPLVQEEQFGPALPILTYDTVDEAVERANGTQLGLGGSVWGTDTEEAVRVARRLQSGSAWVNRHGLVVPDIPFGGFKMSGVGRANGQPGFDSYCELQTISIAKPRPA